LRILRGFLGVTFVFAGAQKLLDPNFLHPGGLDYIGTQLQGFAKGTPAGPLLLLLARVPAVTGVGIALLEIAIGLGTLLAIAPMTAALGGALVSLTLLLSATWHVHPYFLGSDSIYAVAWLALLTGLWETARARTGHVVKPLELIDGIDRREFLRGGALAGLTLTVAAVAKAFGAPLSPALGGSTRADEGTGSGSSGSTGSSGSAPQTPPGSATAGGSTITTLDRLPVGKAIGFTAPGVGAAVLLRLANDSVAAYSRSCTHAGCLVGYDPSARVLFCPCHGAEFDPAQEAAPISGPANTALQRIDVIVDPQTGDISLAG
jgi:thiosulfate dehydrogenase (quinone) large subunit